MFFRKKLYTFSKTELMQLNIHSTSMNNLLIFQNDEKKHIGITNDVYRGTLHIAGCDFSKTKCKPEIGIFKEKQERINEFIENNLGDTSKINGAYTQEILKLGIEILTGIFTKLNKQILISTPKLQNNNLFSANGDIYIKTNQSHFAIYKIINGLPNKIPQKIKGPIEILFKLTNNGFELLTFSTTDKNIYQLIQRNIQSKSLDYQEKNSPTKKNLSRSPTEVRQELINSIL